MEVHVEQQDGSTVVAPKGDVDLSCSRDLQTHLRDVFAKKPTRVVVDLDGVPYMDSSGVATLVEGMQIARKQSVALVLCRLQPRVRSIFEIARLDKVFTIVDELDQAT
ncbi:MAG: STAS domain-containing protein [Phycisphaerales bacterium]